MITNRQDARRRLLACAFRLVSQTLVAGVLFALSTANVAWAVADGDAFGGSVASVTNDQCRNQIEVPIGSTNFTNVGATTDGPEEPGVCRFNFYDDIGADIWYRHTATCNGQLTVDLCDSAFDTKVAVYNECLHCPVTSSPLACNDDFCGLRSLLTLPVAQGQCLTIRIGGYFSAQGNGVMKIRCDETVPMGACCSPIGQCIGTLPQTQCQEQGGVWHEGTNCNNFACPVPTPANDQCSDCARVLSGAPFDGTTVGATGTDISSCTSGDTKDVWICWTADCTGRARIGTCAAANFDTSIAVFDDCNGNQLACNDDACGASFVRSQVDMNVTEGTTYFIRVSGASGSSGTYRLTVDPCRNACCISNGACQLAVPSQCVAGGGEPGEPGAVCLGDLNGNGKDDACEFCPTATIASADPPSGTLDARQPHSQASKLPRQGIGALGGDGVEPEPITITLSSPKGGAEACFQLCETRLDPLFGANGINSVTHLGGGVYRIFLSRPITAGGVTTISYLGDGSYVEYVAHPANINGDAAASPSDILDLIDNLNGVLVPPLTPYRCDCDRSSLCAPADILTLIDLLNGAGEFDPWNESQRPVNDQCP